MESEYAKPEIIVKHFIKSRSTTIIGGCTGVGKSWFSLNLAMSVAGGLPFMNYFETKKKKVIYAQFELTNGEIQERFDLLKPRYWSESESIQKNLMIVPKVTTYEEQWRNIERTVKEKGLTDTVLIVDNLYTSVSTETDLSNNQDVMRVVKGIDEMADEHNLHIVVITHHLKGVKDTPILIDNILGGASLTRSASNVFQMKKSRLSNELLVGMITKNRGEQCELLEVPFKIKMVNGYFERGEIISNENIHYIEAKERWELKLVKDLDTYLEHNKMDAFDRDYLWSFLAGEGWDKTPSNENKVTRFINRCMEWGLIKKHDHNKYSVIKGVLD
jgi:RecA-family ATPase